ncbi:Uncharacterised protein [Mycobacteroides abscessus subsp. abscessus]|nr:Uncharacterised protein [Mycobacteroides abscessus subsp. abscessus]
MRSTAPTRVGTAIRKNLPAASMPYFSAGMNSTITDQIDQIENPTCSAKTDQIRLRRAMCLPPASHASTSSASQCSMLRLRVSVLNKGLPKSVGPNGRERVLPKCCRT